MSRPGRKVRDRRAEEGRARRGVDVRRRITDAVRFQAPENDVAPDAREEEMRAALDGFLTAASPAIGILMAPHWGRPILDSYALFVTDNTHDNGVAALMAGADPRMGAVQWIQMPVALALAKIFSDDSFGSTIASPAPPGSIRMLTIFRKHAGIRVWAPEELRKALNGAMRQTVSPAAAPTEACEDLFAHLVESDPGRLLGYLRDPELDPTLLTFAAEIAGRIEGAETVQALLPLLNHPKAYVREGAVYGLALHPDDPHARAALRAALDDPSPGVRAAAGEQINRGGFA